MNWAQDPMTRNLAPPLQMYSLGTLVVVAWAVCILKAHRLAAGAIAVVRKCCAAAVAKRCRRELCCWCQGSAE